MGGFYFHSLDFEALEVAVGILVLVRLLTHYGPKPPAVIDDGAEPVICQRERETQTCFFSGSQRTDVWRLIGAFGRRSTHSAAIFGSGLHRSTAAEPGSQSHLACHDTYREETMALQFCISKITTQLKVLHTLLLSPCTNTNIGYFKHSYHKDFTIFPSIHLIHFSTTTHIMMFLKRPNPSTNCWGWSSNYTNV